VKGTLGGVIEIRNVFSASIVQNGGESLTDIWEQYINPMYYHIRLILANTVHFYEMEILETSEGKWYPIETATMDLTGAGTTEWMPNAVAAVMLGKAPGVRHVGRKFFSGVGISGVVGNALGSTFLAHLASALVIYIAPFTTFSSSTFAPGVITKVGVFHPFTGGIVNSLLGSQRRRKPGVGI
jgi:hypothetical protein